MSNTRVSKAVVVVLTLFFSFAVTSAQKATKQCFSADARKAAVRAAKVWMPADPAYDPVKGYGGSGARNGAPPSSPNGLTAPIACTANPKKDPGSGTTPKFYCSVAGVTEKDGDLIRYKIKPHFKGQSREKRNGEIYGEFLSSRFSQALGFFADDEWVADVTCPDCEKSLTSKFQGAPFSAVQPAAGIELSLGRDLDANCDDKASASIASALSEIGSSRAEVDAFKLWLAFIDHGDTKTDNQKFTCLNSDKAADGSLTCRQAVFYVSDMGSTFGHSTSSENKARLARWRGKDPIKVSGGRCTTTAKSVGDANVGEEGRALLARELQRLIDQERSNGTITKVFEASRNAERDEPANAWTNEFIRKANLIINARCGG